MNIKRLSKTPDFGSYDWIVINTSAGKDSLAMLAALRDELSDEDMKRVVVVHCDLGRVEWEGTRELAERQATALGFVNFEIVARKQDLLDQILQRRMFPGPSGRYCTSDQKTAQVHKLFTRLAKQSRANGVERQVRILSCLGFTPDEGGTSCDDVQANGTTWKGRRADECAKVLYTEKKPSNGTKHVDKYYPLHDWTVADVWNLIRSRGLEYHAAYDLGMTRLSCVFCVFGSRSDLRIAARANPTLLDAYVAVEKEIGHRFQNSQSLEDLQNEIA